MGKRKKKRDKIFKPPFLSERLSKDIFQKAVKNAFYINSLYKVYEDGDLDEFIRTLLPLYTHKEGYGVSPNIKNYYQLGQLKTPFSICFDEDNNIITNHPSKRYSLLIKILYTSIPELWLKPVIYNKEDRHVYFTDNFTGSRYVFSGWGCIHLISDRQTTSLGLAQLKSHVADNLEEFEEIILNLTNITYKFFKNK